MATRVLTLRRRSQGDAMERFRRPRLPSSIVLYAIFVVVAATILYPLVWMVYSSFKPNDDIFAHVFGLPHKLYFHNFVEVFQTGHLGIFFRNSLFISGVSTAGIVLLSSMTAYAFTVMSFPGKKWLFLFFLIGLMVPAQALIISGYRWISILGLIDTYWALILMYLSGVSFGILVLRDFFESVPREIREAARMDGAKHWHLYTRIMLPLARPSLATIGILYFMAIWNDFLYPLLFLQSSDHYTVPLGIFLLSDRYHIEWGVQMAGLTVATAVPVIVYLIFQRQFVRALTAGSLKG
jgi:ABC-type glycerol-3-phosphate transport system permease component